AGGHTTICKSTAHNILSSGIKNGTFYDTNLSPTNLVSINYHIDLKIPAINYDSIVDTKYISSSTCQKYLNALLTKCANYLPLDLRDSMYLSCSTEVHYQ
ncbi:hypothetical protein MJN47_25115, partial [Salmonella enterica subsp. enterica serovar Lubbock]|nr:hypothetical protein [Salmonella enterica subsp. enterica serovar Lubbock]